MSDCPEILSTISFRDEQFLIAEGLNPNNVMQYFYLSQFYALTGGHSSINEMIRRGSIAPFSATRVDGDIYVLVSSNSEGETGLVDQAFSLSRNSGILLTDLERLYRSFTL